MSASRRSAAAAAATFAALAVLVAAGAFTHLDQWSIDHLMPGSHFSNHEESLVDGLVPLLHDHWDTVLGSVTNVVTLPASFLVALAIVVWRSRLLAAGLVAAVAVEVLCKEVLERPALHAGAVHIAAFDSSFPSGHALRTVLVAAAAAPLLGRAALAWAAVSVVLLVAGGWHTPSDVAGGVVLGVLALLVVRGAGALGRRRLARA